jgi:hypothetical protein
MRLFRIGLLVLAALLPIAPILIGVVLAAGLIWPAASSCRRWIEDTVSDAQPVALVALSHFRAPPARVHFA